MDGPPEPWPARREANAAQEEHDAQIHALRTPLTEVILRVNLLRRHVRRSDDSAHLDAELAQIEIGLSRLVAVIAHLDETQRRGR